MTTEVKRNRVTIPQALFGIFFMIGIAWSWYMPMYDLTSPVAKLMISALSALASYGLMLCGFRLFGLSGKRSQRDALIAILPWNGVYFSQLPYIGYILIPFEIIYSMALIRRLTRLVIWKALLIAVVVRGLSFGLTILIAEILKNIPG